MPSPGQIKVIYGFIYLTVSLRQALQGQTGPRPVCPVESHHTLVRDGTDMRHAQDGRGVYYLAIQRYRCQACGVTYSALPYDCRPYTSSTWPLVLAVGWIWHRVPGWTWEWCHQWLSDHQIDLHQRTLDRWAARRSPDYPAGRAVDCADVRHAVDGGVAAARMDASTALAGSGTLALTPEIVLAHHTITGWVLLAIAHTDKHTELVLLPHATATNAGTSIPIAGTTFSAP